MSTELVYIDTSVFIDFFRDSDKALHNLIEFDRVVIFRYVRWELLLAARKNEIAYLKETLDGLQTYLYPEESISKLEENLPLLKNTGLMLA